MRRHLPVPLLLGALALAVTACGSSAPSTSATTSSSATAPATATLPSVGHAYDVKVAPTIGAGHLPAPTTLQVRNLVVGTGATANASSTVVVQYVGADYANGKVFNASWSSGGAATFPLSGVVPGFAKGIVGMKVGGRREVVIPPALAYGAAGRAPAVGPNETLVFVIDLKGLEPTSN